MPENPEPVKEQCKEEKLAITDEVKSALDAAGESAHRCRVVSLSLVTASVLAFMAWWNSVSWSWIHVRQDRLDEAILNWGETNNEHGKAYLFIQGKWPGKEKFYGINSAAGTNLFNHLLKLRDSIDTLGDHEARFVKVPIFGIGFDINDLGTFAGIGFSTLLLILGFSLKRELSNVRLYFELLKEAKMGKHGYNLLAMRQVLTMPLLEKEDDTRWAWSILQWLPISAPLVVQIAIVINDFATLKTGLAWHEYRTYGLIGANCVAVLLVMIFTGLCFFYRRKITAEWGEAHAFYFPPGAKGKAA